MNLHASISASLLILASIYHVCGAQLNIDIDNDMSRPTFGGKEPTSSSISYDDRNGLNVKGHLNELLGPPLKIANGLQNYAGIGQTTYGNQQTPLRPGNAILGLDSNLLEMAGMPHLIKGGLLMGKAAAKVGGATLLGGIKGKKIASIIELPVKLIALKELALGSALTGLGRMKNQHDHPNNYPEQQIEQQQQIRQESTSGSQGKNPLGSIGDKLMMTSQSLKDYGRQQMIQGTTDSINMFANHLQQTANNAAAGLKLLPIILDLPNGGSLNLANNNNNNPSTTGTKTSSSSIQSPPSSFSGSPVLQGLSTLFSPIGPIKSGIFDPSTSMNTYQTGGSNVKGGSQGFSNLQQNLGQTFNGLTGLLGPGGIGGLFGLGGANSNGLAAVMDAANPLTNILMNLGPNAKPFLFPLNNGGSFGGKPSGGRPSLFGNLLGPQSSSTSYNFIPGIKMTETSNSNLPNLNLDVGSTGASSGVIQQSYEQPRKTIGGSASGQPTAGAQATSSSATIEQNPIRQSAS